MDDQNSEAKSTSSNPFHFGPASPEEFVGRWSLVDEMAKALAGNRDSFACIGGRRFGKTSLLGTLSHALEQRLSSPPGWGVLPIMIDPMLAKYDSEGHFFANLLSQVRNRIEKILDKPTSLDETGINEVLSAVPLTVTAESFGNVLNEIFDLTEDFGGPRRLVVLIDEMDSLLDYTWHQDLFAQLRASIVSGPARARFRLVLAGSQRFANEATERGSPLWNVLQLKYLTNLDEPSTYELIDRAQGLPPSVKRAVWQQCGGHPFLAQYLLKHLWNLIPSRTTEADVADSVDLFLQQETAQLEGWSKAIGREGMQTYGFFIDESDWLNRSDIVKLVDDPRAPVTKALTTLCYHGFIVPSSSWNQFRRAGSLLQKWYIQEAPGLIAGMPTISPSKAFDKLSVEPTHPDAANANSVSAEKSPWKVGSFYLVGLAVIMTLIAVIATNVHWTALPIVIIGGLLSIVVIGALQLRQSGRLSEAHFLTLMVESLKRLPLLRVERGAEESIETTGEADESD